MPTTRNADIVRAVYDAFNKRALADASAYVSPDFEGHDVATGETFHGPDGFRQYLEAWIDGVPDGRITVACLICQDAMVVTEHTANGHQTGALVGAAGVLPATGRSVELNFSSVIELVDNRIRRMRIYWDRQSLLDQLGFTPGDVATS